jgi:two-component system cell cycle response regulator CtrA
MRILIIEDDSATAKTLIHLMKSEGFMCDATDLGEDGLEIGRLYEYDVIVLDLVLPDINGYEVLRRLRGYQVRTPVLVLSGLNDTDDVVKGLGFGADDYLRKPYSKDELLARINAIVRRSRGHSESIIRTGKLMVDLQTRTASVVGGEVINLTGKEYAILELMSLRKGTTLSKEVFLAHLYNGIDEPELKIIDVFICKLRRKLQEYLGDDSCIETVWGRGYVLRDNEKTIDSSNLSSFDENVSANISSSMLEKKKRIMPIDTSVSSKVTASNTFGSEIITMNSEAL